MNTHPSIFILWITTNLARTSFHEETVSSPIYSFAVDDLVAEKGDEASSSQALSEKIRQS
jgi:hypothetical protein